MLNEAANEIVETLRLYRLNDDVFSDALTGLMNSKKLAEIYGMCYYIDKICRLDIRKM